MMLKLLYLATSPGLSIHQSGGAGTHIRGTLKGFRQHDLHVLPLIGGDVYHSGPAAESAEPTQSKALWHNGKLKRLLKKVLPNKVRILLRDIRTLWQDYKFAKVTNTVIESFAPDAIYERSCYLSTFGSRLAKKLKVPYFLETDGCMVEIIDRDYGVFSVRAGNFIEQRKLRMADFVVTMNQTAIKVISEKFRLTNSKFLVKTLGIEISDFTRNSINTNEIIKRLSADNKFIVGFVGAISSYHGVHHLIDAASELNKSGNTDILILIIGWSQEGERLKQIANERDLTNVVFVGRVDKEEIANYYNIINVGVVPDSEQIMYPIKILEYGIFDLPVLVPAYDVFRDIIEENVSGYLFAPRNSVSLSKSMIELSKKREECIETGKRWSLFVRQNFRWRDTVEPTVEALKRSVIR